MISGKPITLGHGQAYIGLDSVRQGKLGTTAIGMKESLMNETPITNALRAKVRSRDVSRQK